MNVVEICQYKYPGQVEAENISFRQPEEEILIAMWKVPNEPQPTEKELLEYGVLHERAIEINTTTINVTPLAENVIDNTARSKGYGDGVSCSSYATSTNVIWKNEAIAFIAWRDSVWDYLYALLARISDGRNPIPSVLEIIDGIPPMVWPN